MSEILEIIMVLCFGISWPMNLMRAYRARTAKGLSLGFYCLVFFGYMCGIASKLMQPVFKWYVMFFYVLNSILVGMAIIVYFRNRRIDRQAEKENLK